MKKKKTNTSKPKSVKTNKTHKHLKKQHPKHFLKVYWPYIPLLFIVTFGLLFGSVFPQVQLDKPATLAYSTEMSINNLLSGTNAERTSRGLAPLALNAQLNSSAAAKAADMRDRNYWAHNTPDGQEPWIFFDAAGYNYQKAGENLAYGFSTSFATITGWMNSPSHRDNMLDDAYTEVGFGFVNSPNFVNTGEETIVVAHYGRPLGAVTSPPPAPEPVVQQQQTQSLPATAVNQPTEITQPPEPVSEPVAEEPTAPIAAIDPGRINQPINSDNPIPDEPKSINISRLQQWTNGDAPWSAVVATVFALIIVLVWLVKHAVLVKRYIHYGEHFVAHHPILDVTVLLIAAVAVYLSQSSGVVL